MTTAVLLSQNRAISLASDATTARVVSLELLAAQVAAADAARRDWETAHRMAANNDKYRDLVARTAADQHATTEITGLAEQAAEAAQALRETLQQATLAAEALALPEPRYTSCTCISARAMAHPMITKTFILAKDNCPYKCKNAFVIIKCFVI